MTHGMAMSCDAEGRLAGEGESSALTTALASLLTCSRVRVRVRVGAHGKCSLGLATHLQRAHAKVATVSVATVSVPMVSVHVVRVAMVTVAMLSVAMVSRVVTVRSALASTPWP